MKNVKDMTPYELRMNVMQTVARDYKLGARTAVYEVAMKRIVDAIDIVKDVRDTIVTDSMFPYRPEEDERNAVSNARKFLYGALMTMESARKQLDIASGVTRYAATQLDMELSEALRVD